MGLLLPVYAMIQNLVRKQDNAGTRVGAVTVI